MALSAQRSRLFYRRLRERSPSPTASISPNSGTVGDSNKTISVTGQNLEDAFGVTSVSISGSGVSSSVSNPGTSNATVTYSIANNGSTGAQSLTMSNSFGTSNPQTFTVVDPAPNVTGVSPSIWNAGACCTASNPVTITGNNFGTNPTVSIVGPTGPYQVTTSNPSDTSVTASFAVPANSPSGPATVTVTSTGFNGTGFYPGNSGNSASSNYNGALVDANTPAPVIMMVNTPTALATCTGGTQLPNYRMHSILRRRALALPSRFRLVLCAGLGTDAQLIRSKIKTVPPRHGYAIAGQIICTLHKPLVFQLGKLRLTLNETRLARWR